MINGDKWGNKNENLVLDMRDSIITNAINKGVNVIVDDTNLNPYHIKRIKKLIGNKAIFETIDFATVPLDICIKRDKQRKDCVGDEVIKDMYEKYLAK